jgi:hypothetical protein
MKTLFAILVSFFVLAPMASASNKWTLAEFANKQDQYAFLGCKIRVDGWDKSTVQNYVTTAPGIKFAWRVYFPLGKSECNDLILKENTYGRLKSSRGL